MNDKFIQVLSSSNFKISIISLILLALGYNNIDTKLTAQEWYSMFDGKNMTELLSTVAVLLFNTISKIYVSIKTNGFSFGFLKNSNFISTIIVTLSIVISAITSEYVAGILISIATLVFNIFFQINQPVKEVKTI